MKTKIFVGVIFLLFLIIGCSSSNDNPAAPPPPTSNGSNTATVTLSGVSSGTFDTDISMVNAGIGNGIAITLSSKDGKNNILLGSSIVGTGTYNIPTDYSVVFTSESDSAIYELYSGTVKIDALTSKSVSGNFSGKAHPQYFKNLRTDSTKVLNISAPFSFSE